MSKTDSPVKILEQDEKKKKITDALEMLLNYPKSLFFLNNKSYTMSNS